MPSLCAWRFGRYTCLPTWPRTRPSPRSSSVCPYPAMDGINADTRAGGYVNHMTADGIRDYFTDVHSSWDTCRWLDQPRIHRGWHSGQITWIPVRLYPSSIFSSILLKDYCLTATNARFPVGGGNSLVGSFPFRRV